MRLASKNGLSALAIFLCLSAEPACDVQGRATPQSAPESATPTVSAPATPPSVDPCDPAPPDRGSLVIDDFDANDGRPPRSHNRIAYWWSMPDGTPGTLLPSPAEADDTNRQRESKALRIVARDFKKWGAIVGISVFWSRGEVRCPLNASAYGGLEFRAKGNGSLALQVVTRDTASVRSGGACEKGCFDHYQRVLQIESDWTKHSIRWGQLRQQGWGMTVPLRLERVVGFNFSAQLADLPVDVWIDDLVFIAGPPVADAAGSGPT